MMRRAWVLGLTATLSLTLAACQSSDNESGQSASDSPSATRSVGTSQSGTAQSGSNAAANEATAAPSENVPEPTQPIDGNNWSLGPIKVDAKPDPSRLLVFKDFRIGKHDGFTRVVVEFAGTGTSGYQVLYGEKPLHQGKGDPIDLKGVSFLDVVLFDTAMPVGTPYDDQYYSGENTKTEGYVTVAQDGTFEANTHLAIGLDDVHEYQVGTLENPSRLVIDIKD